MKKTYRFLLAVSTMLAMAFTFSCGEHGDDDPSGPGSVGNLSSSSEPAGLSSDGQGSSSSSSGGNNITYGSFTDQRDGNEYKTIVIGTQTWMAENLNFKEEQIGPTRGSKCYDDKESNCDKYGRLYEWYDAEEVCPDGWHLPTIAEWNTLISYVGNDAGTKLKAMNTDWRDGPGTDDYGFAALPGGQLSNEFADINLIGRWWTATTAPWNGDYKLSKNIVGTENGVKEDAEQVIDRIVGSQLSVRCVLGSSSSSSITYGEIEDIRDNKKYRTVRIGTQNWMAENLNFETANGSVCYDNKESNCDTYGRLYNWETAKTACPSGWKLPTASEWNALISFGDDASRKLKAKTSNWGDSYGIDKYGFAALPGGQFSDEFADINLIGRWWTATTAPWNGDYKLSKDIVGTENGVKEGSGKVTDVVVGPQLSVRCIEI